MSNETRPAVKTGSALTNILLVSRREYLERVRAKSFLIMTVLIPVLMGGAIFAMSYINRGMGSAKRIAVITDIPHFGQDLQTELTDTHTRKQPVVDVHAPTEPGVRDRLKSDLDAKGTDLDGYLVVTSGANANEHPTFEWVPRVQSDVITRSRVADAARGALTRERLQNANMTSAQIDTLMQPVDLDPNDKSNRSTAAVKSAYGMYFLMYFIILFYGMNVARSIIEEKTSRVFEVMLATIKPREMLAGKVIGVGAVGLTQVGIWIVLAVIGLKSGYMADTAILPSPGQSALFVLFFLLGYLLYSSIAAALGAMTNSEQELQQMQIFLMMPLIFSSLIIFNVITNPDGTIAKIFSLVPFTAPLIMYTRVIVGHPGVVGVAAALAGLVVTVALVLWIASRIYRVGILMYGKKPNLPEILRWLKYS